MAIITFQKEKIDPGEQLIHLGTPADGCVITFTGMPRNKSMDKDVLYLEYELYESMAYKEMKKIADHAQKTWPLGALVIIHRFGRVELTEASIFIAVASPHRAQAYEASRFIIDTIKSTVPIWKKEVYSDGTCWVSDRA
jgi:molybdopterin synthase catalytic subunit